MKAPGARIFFALIFLLCLVCSSPATSISAASVLEGTVVNVADGDTITVLDSDKVQHRVRIAGIDAPEKGQAFGNASRKRLGELVARKDVRIEFKKHDRYGSIVGKVLVTPRDCLTCGKTLDVGLAQVTTGMAWWYRKYAHEQSPEDQGRYEFAEQEAKAKRSGLWQDKNPQPPWEFRAIQRGR
jgi:endonuclease YncB( thermonuclease family)